VRLPPSSVWRSWENKIILDMNHCVIIFQSNITYDYNK
jgi:hypothetical protein